MNVKNLIISGLVGGVVISLLSNIPFINLVNCLLCAGFWGGAILAAWLYRRMTGTLTLGQGVIVGLVAGAIAGFLGLVLSFFNLAGLGMLFNTVTAIAPESDIPPMDQEIEGALAWAFNIVGVLVTVALGALGGLIGGLIFRKENEK